ncbi:MAG: signal peptidase I [Clostridia bacterium]
MQKSYNRATREEVEALLEKTMKEGGESTHSGRPKKKRSVGHVLMSVISTLLVLALFAVLGSLLYTKAQGELPHLFGYRIFHVETGSMIPTLPIGTLLLVKQPADPDLLTEGEIITYQHEDSVITHRIVEAVYEDGGVHYRTKGDNPVNGVDPWVVLPQDVLGVLVYHFSFSK